MPEGAEPADLPIEQTTEFPLVLNPRTANVLTFGLPEGPARKRLLRAAELHCLIGWLGSNSALRRSTHSGHEETFDGALESRPPSGQIDPKRTSRRRIKNVYNGSIGSIRDRRAIAT
jgi:hypothetical protein